MRKGSYEKRSLLMGGAVTAGVAAAVAGVLVLLKKQAAAPAPAVAAASPTSQTSQPTQSSQSTTTQQPAKQQQPTVLTDVATKPATPQNVKVAGYSNSSVLVTWDPVPGAKEYMVVQLAANGKENVVGPFTTPRLMMGGLAKATAYSVQVIAMNALGASPRSATATGSTLA